MTKTIESITSQEHGSQNSLMSDAFKLLMLSVPMIIAQMAQMASGLIDIVMAGHMGEGSKAALGTISSGSSLWIPLMIFLMGVLYVMIPKIGQLIGNAKTEEVVPIVGQGLIIGLFGGALVAIPLFFGGSFIAFIGVDEEIVPDVSSYVRWIALGLPGFGLFCALRYVFDAHELPVYAMMVIVFSIILKIVLNYAFIYGYWGAAVFGIVGCGVSTAIVFWVCGLLLLLLARFNARLSYIWHNSKTLFNTSMRQVGKLLLEGFPIALSFLSDYLMMAVVTLFIATISLLAVSSHQIAFSAFSIALVIPLGLSMAATVLISQALGAKDFKRVNRIILLGLVTPFIVSLLLAILLLFKAETIVQMYTDDDSVIVFGAALLQFAGIVIVVDVIVVAAGFLLRGLGDLVGPFLITAVAYWLVGIPLGYVLCFTDLLLPAQGTIGWWYGLAGGLFFATIGMLYRLYRHRRSIRLNELREGECT